MGASQRVYVGYRDGRLNVGETWFEIDPDFDFEGGTDMYVKDI